MAVIFGSVVVLTAVLVGFTMAGGHVGSLIHPSEFITIGGAAMGAMLIMSPAKVLMDLWHAICASLKGPAYSKAACYQLLKLFYEISMLVRRDGLLAIDQHISDPSSSELFKKCPLILNNPHICHFICEALSLIASGSDDEAAIRSAMESEISVVQREHHAAVGALTKTADSLPGFGIVAAVLGIVVTMHAIDGPVEEIGHKVGAALVGTFLGILLAYGFFAPVASRLESLGEQEITFLQAATTASLSLFSGKNPRDIVNNARRILGTDCRPTHKELKTIFGESE